MVKYIFTGRSSAFSTTPGGKTTRAGNGEIAGLKTITPRIIAYGACMVRCYHISSLWLIMESFQLRFAISNQESWNKLDGEFNMQEFYWNVVGIFEDSGDFGAELLAWWSRYVLRISCYSVTHMPNETTQGDTWIWKRWRKGKGKPPKRIYTVSPENTKRSKAITTSLQ